MPEKLALKLDQISGSGLWRDRPRHDEASHAADAFLTFACSNVSERPKTDWDKLMQRRFIRGIV